MSPVTQCQKHLLCMWGKSSYKLKSNSYKQKIQQQQRGLQTRQTSVNLGDGRGQHFEGNHKRNKHVRRRKNNMCDITQYCKHNRKWLLDTFRSDLSHQPWLWGCLAWITLPRGLVYTVMIGYKANDDKMYRRDWSIQCLIFNNKN